MNQNRYQVSRCNAGWLSVVALLWSVAFGCGDSSGLVPVSGKVTLNGKPIAGASLTFQPIAAGKTTEAGQGSYARTDDEGSYELRTALSDELGAIAGRHVVLITTSREDNAKPEAGTSLGEQSPRAFLDGSVTFEVPAEGTSEADFELSKP